MKKFYAIMAAALAATCVASAQLPSTSLNEADLTPVTGVTMTMADFKEAPTRTVSADIKGQSIRKAASRADENEALYGEYVFTIAPGESIFTSRMLTTKIYPNEKGDGVIVSNLYYSDVDPLPATIEWRDIEFSNGTFNCPVLVIKGLANGPTPYVVIDDKTYYLALYNYTSGEEGGLYGNDLMWLLDPETGEATFWYGDDWGLSFWTPAENNMWNGHPMVPGADMYKKNAEMTAMFFYYDSETETSGFEEATCPVWTYAYEGNYVDANQQPTGETFIGVFTAGWGLSGMPFRFIVEDLGEEQYVAAAYEQVGAVYEDDEFYFCDLAYENGEPNFAWIVNGEEKIWMVANVGVDGDGNTVFSQDGEWCLFNEEVGIVTYWQEGITVFDYNIGVGGNGGDEPDGVEAIDSNDNAPAEYYNLQGVKVANPTPGQLYIVKQGSKVSKVIR